MCVAFVGVRVGQWKGASVQGLEKMTTVEPKFTKREVVEMKLTNLFRHEYFLKNDISHGQHQTVGHRLACNVYARQ